VGGAPRAPYPGLARLAPPPPPSAAVCQRIGSDIDRTAAVSVRIRGFKSACYGINFNGEFYESNERCI
jgi:hypothetical protein